MVLLIVSGVIALFLGWLLFTPITLKINTIRDQYALYIWGLGRANLLLTEDDLSVRVKIAWWSKNFSLFPSPKDKMKKEKPTKAKRKKDRKKKFPFAKVIRLIKTCKVKYFRLDLDTDNYIHNAYLFPILYFLNGPKKSVNINFLGRNECQLEVSNRVAKILLAFLK